MHADDYYWFALGVLSVWRITHLLQAEDGPWEILVLLRGAVGNGVVGAMLDCFACLSLWVALPFAVCLGYGWGHGVLLWLSFSGAAMLLERMGKRESDRQPPYFIEDKE